LYQTYDLKNGACGLSSLVLCNEWVQGKASRALLLMARHQCNIHCGNSRVAYDESKWKWAPKTTRDTRQRVQGEYAEHFLVMKLIFIQGRAEVGQTGLWPRAYKAGGIQRVKLQKLHFIKML